jgi:beta-mannosidase
MDGLGRPSYGVRECGEGAMRSDTIAARGAAPDWGPWWCCAHPAASIAEAEQLKTVASDWLPAIVPGTVAAALAAIGRWNLDQPFDADSSDWFYRTTFTAPNESCRLYFDGLATLAEIWLNGRLILTADNMFRSYQIDITPQLRPENELVLAFRSLTHALNQKRPRPRWKTNLVAHQQLRWRRTTLLGRIPGWSPPVPPVGPWRSVRFETGPISDVRIASALKEGVGVVTLRACVHSPGVLGPATFSVGAHAVQASVAPDGASIHAEARVPNPPLWWPHTHGKQALLDWSLDSLDQPIACGKIGFRDIRTGDGNHFGLQVNGVPVYCRGACWTVGDIITLDGTRESLAHDLGLARNAGANMLRVGGTMIYESDLFYRLCDELGILVWQDFMFANMDYPVEDADFAANIETEAVEQIGRLAQHPCVAVYCGNSEVEQQAAMLGMPQDLWRNCSLPFHLRDGVAHYFGVGAYLRSPAEIRKDDVGFSPECLGFANIPEQATLNSLGGGDAPPVHHPQWKQRVPRDTGAGWDFDDVRDHYLKLLFDVDPVQLRSFDPARYLQLSRVVTGEMMSQVFAEWRSPHSHCRGGLVWFYKDLWPGAGWGIIDSKGVPKAPYYALRRAWRSRQVVITNEGLDGLDLHVINEAADHFHGRVELVLLKDGHVVVALREIACHVAPRSTATLSADAILEGFYDVAYAYRFGPPKHDVTIATLLDEQGRVIGEAHDFPAPREPAYLPTVSITAAIESNPDGSRNLTLGTDRFLYSVSFDVKGFSPDDNYFHLSPLRPKTVRFTPVTPRVDKFSGYVEALNIQNAARIT